MFPRLGNGSKGNNKKYCGIIVVVGADGSRQEYNVDDFNRDWWDAASKYYPPKGRKMEIPADRVSYRTEYSYSAGSYHYSFQMCVLDAASDFLEHLHGVKLHQADRDWMMRHPYAESNGVPFKHLLTVLQQLVEPYGFGVSRVRIKAGRTTTFTEWDSWVRALGCNPLALEDHTTPNSEMASRVDGVSVELANGLFRLEYGDEPLRPSIIGEPLATTGLSSGHTRYLPPRGKGEASWIVSVQLAHLSAIAYHEPLTLPAYTETDHTSVSKGKKTLQLSEVRKPDSEQVVAILVNSRYEDNTTGRLATGSGHSAGSWYPPYGGYNYGHGYKYTKCQLCNVSRQSGLFSTALSGKELPVCNYCLRDALDRFYCPTCHCDLGHTTFNLPDLVGVENGNIQCRCCKCKTEFEFPEESDVPQGVSSWRLSKIRPLLLAALSSAPPASGPVTSAADVAEDENESGWFWGA